MPVVLSGVGTAVNGVYSPPTSLAMAGGALFIAECVVGQPRACPIMGPAQQPRRSTEPLLLLWGEKERKTFFFLHLLFFFSLAFFFS